MSFHLYDSARRAIVEFEPLQAGRVSIYSCGATVQSAPHLGHVRNKVNFDVLRRWLEVSGYQVTLVAAFIPLLCGLYWRRATNQGALASICCGVGVWLAVHIAGGEDPFIPAQLAGLMASAVGMTAGSLVRQWLPHDHEVHTRLRHGHHAAASHGVGHGAIGVIHRHCARIWEPRARRRVCSPDARR